MRTFRTIFLAAFLLVACSPTTVPAPETIGTSSSAESSKESIAVIADRLNIPWDIAFLPSGELLVTERPGTLLRIGKDRRTYHIEGVRHRGEGGLLGIALHPEFSKNSWIYLYMTTSEGGSVTNRVERYRLNDDALTDRTEIIGNIPGAIYHDGGRIEFGPDRYLYITTGDAGNEASAQDTHSLAGKILRIYDDGSIPNDNPFNNAVYSYGHRNPQGLAWDQSGKLWSTEHGRSGALSGFDELNLIEAGKNYGWPVIEGSETREEMVTPRLHSGSDDTWAPASAAYLDGSIFFGGLRGEALYEAVLNQGQPQLKTHLLGEYGRIRTVRVGPDGYIYMTTSNRDGRGNPDGMDDRIVRIDHDVLE